jgi:hypothetical protein
LLSPTTSNLRIVGGTVDIGAYEYQTPVNQISCAWLEQNGLPIDTNTDTADPDQDGRNHYQEWIAGTNPTNALSVLAMLPPVIHDKPLPIKAPTKPDERLSTVMFIDLR